MRPASSSQWRVCWSTFSPEVITSIWRPGLVVDGPAEAAQRVDVLDLAAGAELRVAHPSDRHVAVDPQGALLHLPVGGADRDEHRPQLVDVGPGVLRRTEIRPADDLEQRDARPVVVDQRVAGVVDPAPTPDVGGLARVLLEVGPFDAHPAPVGQLEPAVDVDRPVVLADLEVLRHVRIEVVLPGEDRRLHRAVQGQTDPDRQLDRLLVEHRQRTRQPERHRVDVGVGFTAELRSGRR